MATISLQHSNHQGAWTQPKRGTVAMVGLIIAESSIFTIFVVAYLYYLGRDVQGPTPKEVLDVPIFYTVCLLSSSFFHSRHARKVCQAVDIRCATTNSVRRCLSAASDSLMSCSAWGSSALVGSSSTNT